MGEKKVDGLLAHELNVGDTVYFCESSKSSKQDRFKKCVVREIYRHHIVVEVIPTMPRATKTYKTSLGRTSINCGDIVVKRNIKKNEEVRYEDLVAE